MSAAVAPVEIRIDDVLATAERVLRSDAEACRVSIDERWDMAIVILVQHAMIRAAGLSYNPATEQPA